MWADLVLHYHFWVSLCEIHPGRDGDDVDDASDDDVRLERLIEEDDVSVVISQRVRVVCDRGQWIVVMIVVVFGHCVVC